MTVIDRDQLQDEKEWISWEDKTQKTLSDTFLTATDKSETIFTALNGVYIALLTFFGLYNNNILKILDFPAVILFLIPPGFWLLGMYYFLQVKKPNISPQRPNDAGAIRRGLYSSNVVKAKYYRRGIMAFSIGVLSIIIAVAGGLYLSNLPVPTTSYTASDVQLVIMEDQVSSLSQVPMEFVPGTNKTTLVRLVNVTNTGYRVELANGDGVDLEKAWVKTIIWKPK